MILINKKWKKNHIFGADRDIFFREKDFFCLFDCSGGWGWDSKPIFCDFMYSISRCVCGDDTCSSKTSFYAFIFVCSYNRSNWGSLFCVLSPCLNLNWTNKKPFYGLNYILRSSQSAILRERGFWVSERFLNPNIYLYDKKNVQINMHAFRPTILNLYADMLLYKKKKEIIYQILTVRLILAQHSVQRC